MIPYQELCDALAKWRSKNGLVNGPSASVRFQPSLTVVTPSSPPDDGFLFDPPTIVTAPTGTIVGVPASTAGAASPQPVLPAAAPVAAGVAAAAIVPAISPETFDGSVDEVLADDGPLEADAEEEDAMTGIHIAPADDRKDLTTELDLDSALVDEDEL